MDFIVEASTRARCGRGAARALRREGWVPAVIYGDVAAMAVSCSAKTMTAFLQDESFRSSVITVKVDGKPLQTLLREVQRHPTRRDIMHVDFQAVSEKQDIAAAVPLHFINSESAPGVRLHHGIFNAVENQVAVHCKVQDLPEFIEVDAADLEIGKSIHLADIAPPPGVRFDEITRGNNPALATVSEASIEVEPAAEAAAEGEETAGEESDNA